MTANSTLKSFEERGSALTSLAEKSIAEGRSRGAEGVVVRTGLSARRRLLYKMDSYSLADSVEKQDFSLELHCGARKGSAVTNLPTEESVSAAVSACLELAAHAPVDDSLALATAAEGGPSLGSAEAWSEVAANLTPEELRDVCEAVLDVVRSEPRIAVETLEVTAVAGWGAVLNSNGVCNAESSAVVSASIVCTPREGELVGNLDYIGDSLATPAQLIQEMRERLAEIRESMIASLRPRKCPSYRGKVILSPDAASEFLLGLLDTHASGRNVADKVSRWSDAVGRQVFSPCFSVRDEPHRWEFGGSGAFDGDGVLTRPTEVVRDGVLLTHLHGCQSARRLGVRSTGHSGGGLHVPIVTCGRTTFSEMVSSQKNILVVERFSGNLDPISGEVSGVAKGSWLYRNGERAGVVTETMISAQLFELAQKILAIGDTPKRVGGLGQVPYVLVDGVSVTGS